MRKSVLAAMAAIAIASASGGALIARAQPPGPPPGGGPMGGPPGGPMGQGMGQRPGPWMHPGPGGWRHGPGEWHQRPIAPGTFSLFFRPANRDLTPADVQTIASALLLWHGNHTWKVVDVAKQSGDLIGFAYAAPDNTVIARFTINSRTGHIERTG